MKQVFILYLLLSCLLVSCYEPYFPETESTRKVLVVNGLITNEQAPYHINLSYAESFDSTSAGVPVSSAQVSVSDNHGNNYFLNETEDGTYVSDPIQFKGIPGYTYTLHISTNDGYKYESDPQKLPTIPKPGNIYAEYANQETINQLNGSLNMAHGANILADIGNQTDSIPRFRFTSNLVIQYFFPICPMFGTCSYYYCWKSDNANPDLNLPGGEYGVNSSSITRHEVCFVDENPMCYALNYAQHSQVITEYKFFDIHNRLIYLNLYGLNNDAYLYYKSMEKQLKSDGKLFDPIAVQIVGNIKCISNPGNMVFGFFEASSISKSAFNIDFRNLTAGQPSIKAIKYILPPEPAGRRIDTAPAFWVY